MGGGGTDTMNVTGAVNATLTGTTGTNTYNISAVLTGTINGGTGNDTIFIKNGGSVSGTVDGGTSGTDTLNYSLYSSTVTATLSSSGTHHGYKGSGTGLGGSPNFDDINSIVGNGTSSSITGIASTSTWTIKGASSGTYTANSNGLNFSGMTTLNGGATVNTFASTGVGFYNGVFHGTINGGSGSANTVDYSLNTVASTYTISAVNSGNIDTYTFTSIQNIKGGSPSTGQNVYALSTNTSSLTGAITDAGNTGKLDYTGRSSAVRVNLTAGTAGATGGISGIRDVTGTSGNDILIGNSGNNILDGGSGGNDILVGISGNDTLVSHGTGRNIMIGGNGQATFNPGSTGGDLIIGGYTIYDTNITALTSIQLEWTSTTTTYANRVAHISGTLSGGLNGSYKLTASTVTTTSGNTVTGNSITNSGLNWYLVSASDASYFNSVKKAGETVTQVA